MDTLDHLVCSIVVSVSASPGVIGVGVSVLTMLISVVISVRVCVSSFAVSRTKSSPPTSSPRKQSISLLTLIPLISRIVKPLGSAVTTTTVQTPKAPSILIAVEVTSVVRSSKLSCLTFAKPSQLTRSFSPLGVRKTRKSATFASLKSSLTVP